VLMLLSDRVLVLLVVHSSEKYCTTKGTAVVIFSSSLVVLI